MIAFINRYATPLITGLFLVSLISGIALFFHWLPSAFHGMHEWLSMVLIVPFALHIWKNWNGLVNYFRRNTIWIPLVASLVVAAPFAVPSMTGASSGGNPAFRAIPLMTQARLADIAPVLKTTPDKLMTKLQQRGYKVASTEQSLNAVAAASGKQASELLFAVFPAGSPGSGRR